LLGLVITILQPYISEKLEYNTNSEETVLINSNFNCGFFINRETLYDILKFKYNIQSIYDPCSYPGIQCKFYYNSTNKEKTGQQPPENKMHEYNKISFMIFRTGSVLIVGKCDEEVLTEIYSFIKTLLVNEYKNISGAICSTSHNDSISPKKKKIRRKTISLE